MWITLEEGTKLELPEQATGKTLVEKLKQTAPHEACVLRVNGTLKDFSHPLKEGDKVALLGFDTPQGKEVFWHTSAHVLAQAILRLYPNAEPTIGPPIEQGFYYDFANLTISEEDFPKIEEEMEKIAKENWASIRHQFASKSEALKRFEKNRYKQEIIQDLPDDSEFTAYEQGEFFDLCRGPHLPNLGKIKALKLMKTSGAYWRGDCNNEMLTRVYAITFPDRKQLKEYLHQLEEAKKRDHKVLGPKLDLFSLKDEAPGMPFIHPKGLLVWNRLLEFIRGLLARTGYVEIKTPTLMTKELWERSGHWKNYRQNMFTSQIEGRDFAIKPMNCPGCILFYKSSLKSYRELPLRIAEIGNVHRYEPSGSLSGLFRVRSFHQDDAHIFMRPCDIQSEILGVLNLAHEIYSAFGLNYHLELSTKPEKDTIGSDKDWDLATEGLKGALDESGRAYKINPGDGAFYGPKIDFHIRDAIGRTWQCGTIQLDMALPERFELEYVDQDGHKHVPVMIHRAIFGSVERFFGILIEHFAGRFPLWLSPSQVRVLTVADRHITYASTIVQSLKAAGFLVELDDSQESVSRKVREAQMAQVNYMITVGDQETEKKTISLRTRGGLVFSDLSLDHFIEALKDEIAQRKLESPFGG